MGLQPSFSALTCSATGLRRVRRAGGEVQGFCGLGTFWPELNLLQLDGRRTFWRGTLKVPWSKSNQIRAPYFIRFSTLISNYGAGLYPCNLFFQYGKQTTQARPG